MSYLKRLASPAFWRRLPEDANCLMFHRVGPPPMKLPEYSPQDGVGLADFRRLIASIAKRHSPLTLREFIERMRSRRLPHDPVTVTFDDGFRDNLLNALPILEELGVSATVYVTSGFVDRSSWPWPYVLADVISRENVVQLQTPNGDQEIIELDDVPSRKAALKRLTGILKFSSAEYRQKTCDQLIGRYDLSSDYRDLYLNAAELRELANHSLITIGGHTHDHLVLDSVSPSEAWRDICRGRDNLQKMLGQKPTTFSYPHGGHNRAVRRMIRDSGFESALAVDSVSFTDPLWYQLPRTCAVASLSAASRPQPTSATLKNA
jgi:peptidoglycan/xylan/chitin deacetylase (PgdA/CDA1 family)